jgi:hypothetical protein
MLARADIREMIGEELVGHVLPSGAKGFQAGTKPPTLIARTSDAVGGLLGQPYGKLIYSVLEASRRGHMGLYMARILLERCLPDQRPTPVQLPNIDSAHDLVEADRRLMAAANAGTISHREWRSGQECILASWEIRKQAKLEEP